MKRRTIALFFVLVLAASTFACAALGGGQTKGSGRVVKGEIEVSRFSGVTLLAGGNLFIEFGAEETLRIEVDDNLVEYYDVQVDSKMLTIQIQNNATIEPSEPVNFYLTVEELDTVVLNGDGKIEVESANLQADQFSVTVSGSGDVMLAGLVANELEAKLEGSGSLEIGGGRVTEQKVVIAGDGSYAAEELRSEVADIEVSGSGSAVVWAVQELKVGNVGDGSIEYVGTPQTQIEGSGSVVVKPLTDS